MHVIYRGTPKWSMNLFYMSYLCFIFKVIFVYKYFCWWFIWFKVWNMSKQKCPLVEKCKSILLPNTTTLSLILAWWIVYSVITECFLLQFLGYLARLSSYYCGKGNSFNCSHLSAIPKVLLGKYSFFSHFFSEIRHRFIKPLACSIDNCPFRCLDCKYFWLW